MQTQVEESIMENQDPKTMMMVKGRTELHMYNELLGLELELG